MSKRVVIILWSIAGLLAAITIVVKSNRSDSQPSPTLLATGDLLLEDFPLPEIATMTLSDADSTVTIQKGESQWLVAERENYPVDFNRFSELVRTLTQVTIAQSMKASPAFNKRFGMDPEASTQEDHGYEVTLADSEGKTLAAIQIGKLTNAQQYGAALGGESGRYLRIAKDPEAVYAVNNAISALNGDPAAWLDTTFLQVRNISSLTFEPAPGTGLTAWSMSRSDASEGFTMAAPPEGMELDPEKAKPLENTLSRPLFSDVITEAEALERRDASMERTLTISTFDGLTYRVTYAPEAPSGETTSEGDDANFIVSFTLEGELKTERTPAEGETEEAAKLAEEAFAKRLQAVQSTLASTVAMADRHFLVPDYVFSQFDISQSALLREKEMAPAPLPSPLQPEVIGDSSTTDPIAAPRQPGNPDALNRLSEEDLQRIIQEAQQER